MPNKLDLSHLSGDKPDATPIPEKQHVHDPIPLYLPETAVIWVETGFIQLELMAPLRKGGVDWLRKDLRAKIRAEII